MPKSRQYILLMSSKATVYFNKLLICLNIFSMLFKYFYFSSNRKMFRKPLFFL